MTFPAQTQDPTPLPTFPITPGSVEGNINDSFFSIRYSFEARAGDNAAVLMENTSGDLDPYLILFTPDGEIVVNDDREDQEGSRDARIAFTAQIDGTYTVQATRFDEESGDSSGTYRFLLSIEGTETQMMEVDPLSLQPSFAVDFTFIDYDAFGSGTLDEETDKQYYALGGNQGDYVRVILTSTTGDLEPQLSILNESLTVLQEETPERPGEVVAYATLPETGWYLIEAGRQSGIGEYSMYVTRLANAVIVPGETQIGEFTPDTPVISYIFQAVIGDRIFSTLRIPEEESSLIPEVVILDLNLEPLAATQQMSTELARIQTEIPRSGTYIIQVKNANVDESQRGSFTLSLRQFAQDISKLDIQDMSYNEGRKGTIEADEAIDYYRFSGKAGELVTVEMKAGAGSLLDSFLILSDAAFNELASNDNIGNTPNARIAQFALTEDGDYYILATRAGLQDGDTTGDYDLELTVGQISLTPGALAATVIWDSEADLNLFVREPSGRIVSWSNPMIPSGGTLQIDSNTNCETPTAQPVEHVYYPGAEAPGGDYIIWVWYQNICMMSSPTPFELTIIVNGEIALEVTEEDGIELQPDERFEASLRMIGTSAVIIEPGRIANPSLQQNASQGGDTLILYGQTVNGTINDDVYARFFQFQGQAGDQVLITAERQTGNLDPIVVLRDADDRNLAMNDDASGTRNSQLEYTLEADGQYIISVTRFALRDGITTGDFRLTLEKVAGE